MSSKQLEPRVLDVVQISDFRLQGGTSHSIRQEVMAQSGAGMSTGLIHVPSRLIRRPAGWSAPILSLLDLPNVVPLSTSEKIKCRVAILRHPTAFEEVQHLPRNVEAEHVVMVANQAPTRADGTAYYDVLAADESIRQAFGKSPVWAPIGPVVRDGLDWAEVGVQLASRDWVNIIAQEEAVRPRVELHEGRPSIGRHSRPEPDKWPSRASVIRRVYPTTGEFDVRILGGAEAAEAVLGKVPAKWEVIPFGGQDVKQFLKGVDFWVYFHHDNWREAYGRAIVEALASGAVVILPHYLRSTYGDAALYAEPDDVQELVRSYWADPEKYLTQSRLGQQFIETISPAVHIGRLREFDVVPRTAPRVAQRSITARGRVMYVTSNGSGMGHLTRLLAISQRMPSSVEPLFVSLSQAVPVLENYDIPYEYVASSNAMGVTPVAWNEYFESRLLESLRSYQPDCVVFDGTVPYRGFLNATERSAVKTVWVRRAMWKAEIAGTQLRRSGAFDLVVEPGELASEYDEGVTRQRTDARRVGPITLLPEEELLSREASRHALGYSPDERVALITLGAGNINDIGVAQRAVLEFFNRHARDWRVVFTKPPIMERQSTVGDTLSVYPLSKYTRAFDFVVSATGYNSFHEWMLGGVPALWVPNQSTATDDQVARGRWAADLGLGLVADETDGESILRGLFTMIDEEPRMSMSSEIAARTFTDGAREVADEICALLKDDR